MERHRRKRKPYERLALLVGLTFFLFAAEVFAAWHEADVAAHSSRTPCQICLTVGALATGNVGSSPVAIVPAPLDFTAAPVAIVELARRITPQLARGPPRAS